ncbi:hypothetical protein XYCOK13_29430 [Xylanibacillus composti]|uniref:Uncharacterized protein n=1 Tax=Xylanibacillus composti TaxID=1572762 RepID=A0A8J4H708_9BACL|nr:hypothetical protein XYCOK13_29430 [Xylanibacillus composti]
MITFIFMGTFGALPYFLTILFQNVHGYSEQTLVVSLIGLTVLLKSRPDRAFIRNSIETTLSLLE